AGVGPGLEAGLQLDEVVTVAERVSQAAAALQLPQNQLVEEIRSLLRGTAQARTSIVASVLFGGAANANRIIRQAREAGNVFEVINERLDSFRFAANATQLTFSGLLARIRDASALAGGTAALPFFEELKGLLGDIGELFVVIERDAEGAISNITPRPEAVALLSIVFNSLREGVRIIREGIGEISVDNLAQSFETLGSIIEGVASVLVGLVQGAIRGFSLIGALAERFSAAVGGIDNDLLRETGELVGTIGVALVGAAVAGATLRGILGLLRSPIVRFIGILGAATLATQQIGTAALGIPLNFREAVGLVQLSFEELFGRVIRTGELAFKNFANLVVQVFTDPIGFIASALQTLLNSLNGAVAIAASLGIVSEETRIGVEDSLSSLERFAQARSGRDNPFLPFKPGEIDKAKQELVDFLADSQKRFDDFAAEVAARDADENTKFRPIAEDGADDAAGAIEKAIRAANEALKGLIDEGLVDQNAISEAIQGAAQKAEDDPNKPTFEPNPPPEGESKLEKFLQGIVENFESGLAITRGVVTSFSNFVASSIVDALDPTKDFDIRERFARFLQDIARLIIQQLVQLAIAKAILGFGTGLDQGGPVPQVPAFADGGDVPGRFSRPSLQPSHVPASDTVPAWLTPGEFVQPVRAVAKYGMDAMEMIRRGAVDPQALRSLAGLSGKKARSVMRGGPNSGFQQGGLITSEVERADSLATSRQADAETNPPIALVVGNDQSLDRLLAGGKKEHSMALKWIDGCELWRDATYGARAYVTFSGWGPATPGRVSPGQRYWSGNGANARTPSLGVQNTWVIGFGYYTTTQSSGNQIRIFTGGTEQCRLQLAASGGNAVWELRRGATLVATSSAFALSQWHYFEFKLDVLTASATYELRLNEVSIMSGSGENLADSGGNGADVFGWQTASGTSTRMDDIYILDSTGATNTTFLGDSVAIEVLPDGDGHQTDFTRSAGTTNYENVDEGPASSADYNHSDTNNQEDYYTHANLPATGLGTIHGIKLSGTWAMATTGSRTARYRYYNGTLEFNAGSDITASGTTLVELPEVVELNPDTGVRWVKSDIDNGFETRVHSNYFQRLYDNYAGFTLTAGISGRRHGTAMQNSNAQWITPVLTSTFEETWIAQVAILKPQGNWGASQPHIMFFRNGTANDQFEMRFVDAGGQNTNDYKIELYRGTTLLATSPIYFWGNAKAWMVFQLKVRIHPTLGSYEVRAWDYFDNQTTAIASATGINTADTGSAGADQIRFRTGSQTATQARFDDLVFWDDTGTGLTDFTSKPLIVYGELPNADVAGELDWVPSSGSTHFVLVDDPANSPSESGEVTSEVVGDVDLYGYQQNDLDLIPTGSPPTVHGIMVDVEALMKNSGTRTVRVRFKDGIDQADDTTDLVYNSTAKASNAAILLQNPTGTPAAWTVADLKTIEFGPKLNVAISRISYEAAVDSGGAGELRLHRTGVEVLFQPIPKLAVSRMSYEAAVDSGGAGDLRLHRLGVEVLFSCPPELAVSRVSYEAVADSAGAGELRLHRTGIELLARTGVPNPTPAPLAANLEFFLHNWVDEIEIETAYSTDITRSPDTNAEQRRSLIQRPERTMTLRWETFDLNEAAAMQRLLRRMTDETMQIPLYPDVANLETITGVADTTIFGNFNDRRFYAGARVVIFQTDEPNGNTYLDRTEPIVRTIQSLTADSLTLTASVPQGLLPFRTSIVPLIDCEVVLEPETTQLTTDKYTVQMTVRELKGPNGLPPSAVGLPSGFPVQLNRPVWQIEPNWVNGVKVRYKRYGSEARQGRRLVPQKEGPRYVQETDYDLFPLTRAEYFNVCTMFDSRRGRGMSFWHVDREFELQIADTDPTFIDVIPFGTFADFNELWTEQNIGAGIVMKSGFVHVVQINTVVDNGSTWRLTTVAGQFLPDPIDLTQVDYFARARISRFREDSMRERWRTGEVAEVRLKVIECMNEKFVRFRNAVTNAILANYTDRDSDTDFDGETHTSVTDMEIQLPENDGLLTESPCNFIFPLLSGLLTDMSSGEPHPDVKVEVWEFSRGDGLLVPAANTALKTFIGLVKGVKRNFGGRKDVVGISALPTKALLQTVTLGQPCNHQCINRLGDGQCQVNMGASNRTINTSLSTIDGAKITVPDIAVPAGKGDRFYEAGFIRRDGLEIKIVEWRDELNGTKNEFFLARTPPEGAVLGLRLRDAQLPPELRGRRREAELMTGIHYYDALLTWTSFRINGSGMYRAAERALERRMERLLGEWEGTPYVLGQSAKGVGTFCTAFVCEILNELYRRPGVELPEIPSDAAMHDPERVSSRSSGVHWTGMFLPEPYELHAVYRLSDRKDYLPLLKGRRRMGPIFGWAGGRFTTKEKVKSGGKGGAFSTPKHDIYRESGWHQICIGPAFCLWEIEQNGVPIFVGPISSDSHPSGSLIDLGGEGAFRIFWGEDNQPINTFLGDSSRVGVSSRWPKCCYVEWQGKRLGPSPNWPQITYVVEVRPQAAILSHTPAIIEATQVLDQEVKNIFSITTGTPGNGYVQLPGDQTAVFKPKQQVELADDTGGGNGTYTVLKIDTVDIDPDPLVVTIHTRVFMNETLPGGMNGDGTIQGYTNQRDDGWNGGHMLAELLFSPWPYGLNLDQSEWDLNSLESFAALVEEGGSGENLRCSMLAPQGQDMRGQLGGIMQDFGLMLPIDMRSGAVKFQPVRKASGTIPNIPQDAQVQRTEIEVQLGSRPVDRIIFSFADEFNAFRDMTLAVDDDGQAARATFFRARQVQIISTSDFGTAARISQRRQFEELAGGGDFRLFANRAARTLLPGEPITADGFNEVLRVTQTKHDPLSGQVEVVVMPDFYGGTISSFITNKGNTGGTGQQVQADPGFDLVEIPEILAGQVQTVLMVYIRAHATILGHNIHISRDNSTYTLFGADSSIMTGGTLNENLDDAMEQDQGAEFTFEGPDIGEVLDLSADAVSWRGGRQLAVFVDPNDPGRNEICFLKKVTFVTGNTYRLDGLIRARYDTWASGLAPQSGWRVFIVQDDDGDPIIDDPLFAPQVLLYGKSEPTGLGVLPLANIQQERINLYGKGLRPPPIDDIVLNAASGSAGSGTTRWGDLFYAIVGSAPSDDLIFQWGYSTPQTSGTGAGLFGAGSNVADPAPEGTFTLEILNLSDVVQRTVTGLTAATYTYTRADRLADFTSEPSGFKIVNNGENAWDSKLNDNHQNIFDRPIPIYVHTGDLASLQTSFNANQYDQALCWVTDEGPGTGLQLAFSNGTSWELLSNWEALNRAVQTDNPTSPYTLLTSDDLVTKTNSTALTLNLPALAAGNRGREVRVKNAAGTTNNITITPNGADTVDGAATLVLTPGQSATIIAGLGTDWLVV
ncbi:Uncharacterized protein (Fragment), partial [Durusdinium trenchii]